MAHPNRRFASLAGLALTGLFACGGQDLAVAPAAATVEDASVAPTPVFLGPKATARRLSAAEAKGALRAGDILLENAQVAAVFGATGGEERVGRLLDFRPQGAPALLGSLALCADEAGRRLPAGPKAEIANDGQRGGPALVRLSATDPRDEEIELSADVLLTAESRCLKVVVQVRNQSAGRFPEYPLGLLVHWGALSPFVPGVGRPTSGALTRSDWLGGEGAGGKGSAALVLAANGRLTGIHGGGWSVVLPRVEGLAPRATHAEELSLCAGQGLAEGLLATRAGRGTVTGQVVGTVRGPRDVPIKGAVVEARERSGKPALVARTDGLGGYTLSLEPGRYTLDARTAGRAVSPAKSLDLKADQAATLDFSLGPESALALALRGAGGEVVPARVTLCPAGECADALRFDVAGGDLTVPIPPGPYTVKVDAGPRRPPLTAALTVPPGTTQAQVLAFAAPLEAPGWLAVDTQVRSGDVLSCQCAGMDGAVTLGAPSSLTGQGVDVPRKARFSAWPLAAFSRPEGANPAQVLAALRALPERPLITVLRPRALGWGYFEAFGFDAHQEVLPRGGFSLDFDLLEVAGADTVAASERTLADFVVLRGQGRALWAVGGSGSEGQLTGTRCGRAFTWVRAAALDLTSLKGAALRGEVVASFGPLITAQGGQKGEPLAVQVKSAGLRPERLRVFVGGKLAQELKLPASGALSVSLPGAAREVVLVADRRAPLTADAVESALAVLALTLTP